MMLYYSTMLKLSDWKGLLPEILMLTTEQAYRLSKDVFPSLPTFGVVMTVLWSTSGKSCSSLRGRPISL